MRKTGILTFVVGLILVLTITSCNAQVPTTAPGTSPTTASIPQVLRLNLTGEPETIDPNRASWAQERTVIMQVFEGLLGFNQDLTLRTVVAEEMPSVENGGISADGKTYTFKLRDDVRWSDGQKVAAKDFEYSIKRLLDPEVAASYAGFYFDIVGAQTYNGSTDSHSAVLAQLRDAVGVKAIDAETLQIQLIRPRPTFLQLMALWPVYPVREDIITRFGNDWTEPPNYIGNGPFVLAEWVHQDHMTLKPNPNYSGPGTKLSEIRFVMVSDINAEMSAYKNNELDMSRVPTGTEKAVMSDAVLSREIIRNEQLSTGAFLFNVATPPFDNVKVRQAILTAIDRAAFVNNVRNGVGKPATSWIPPGMPGYDPELGKEYEFNPTKARQLLAEAGYADTDKLPPLKFQYASTTNNQVIAQFLQGQMKDNLDIDITLEPMDGKAFGQAVGAGKLSWFWVLWGADYPDPDNLLPELFGTGAGNNLMNYSNPDFDILADQAKSELNQARRLEKLAMAQKIVVGDAPMAFMYYRERFGLAKPNLKGLKTTGMDGAVPGDMFLAEVHIQN